MRVDVSDHVALSPAHGVALSPAHGVDLSPTHEASGAHSAANSWLVVKEEGGGPPYSGVRCSVFLECVLLRTRHREYNIPLPGT